MALFSSARGAPEWIIAPLGNPGSQYDGTRHNVGFAVGAEIEKLLNVRINRLRHRALTAMADVEGHRVLLMLPQTYMNLSGEAVGSAARFYKIPPQKVIVISDEMALPPGTIRVRERGSAGGHNGLKSIISALGSEDFPRIRLGVGEPPRRDYDTVDWVLGRFEGEDAALMAAAERRAAEAALFYVSHGAVETMSRFNGKVPAAAGQAKN